MAKAPVKQFEDEALYDVILARPIRVGRTMVIPAHGVQLKGKVVTENQVDIIEATKVAS
ncbi:hypothetical protein ACC862_24230 [Rhizobium ruizarguesonis]